MNDTALLESGGPARPGPARQLWQKCCIFPDRLEFRTIRGEFKRGFDAALARWKAV